MSLYKKYKVKTSYSYIGSVEDTDDLVDMEVNMNAPTPGMIVYVKKLSSLYYFSGGNWQRFTTHVQEDTTTVAVNETCTDYFLSNIKNNILITPEDIKNILSSFTWFPGQPSRFLIFS